MVAYLPLISSCLPAQVKEQELETLTEQIKSSEKDKEGLNETIDRLKQVRADGGGGQSAGA